MELAALSSKGICIDRNHASAELCQTGYEILLDTNYMLSIHHPDKFDLGNLYVL
jgi:hypothetical protein